MLMRSSLGISYVGRRYVMQYLIRTPQSDVLVPKVLGPIMS